MTAAALGRLLAELEARITAYLSGGGLWNPELANHDAVRDLLIDCRDALAQMTAETPTSALDLLRRWQEEYGGSTCTDREKQEEMETLDRETADYLAAEDQRGSAGARTGECAPMSATDQGLIRSAEARPPAREGCVRVPREPTEAMLIAFRPEGCRARPMPCSCCTCVVEAKVAWRCMLAAAEGSANNGN